MDWHISLSLTHRTGAEITQDGRGIHQLKINSKSAKGGPGWTAGIIVLFTSNIIDNITLIARYGLDLDLVINNPNRISFIHNKIM